MKNAFTELAGAATDGQLLITAEVAESCAQQCDQYVQVLIGLRARTSDLVFVESFGTLESARLLGGKFRDLATGEGPGSLSTSLQDHILVVQSMADMFRKAGAAYAATEQDNTANIGRST
ncbi:hypothetical protein [Nocardia harenae]|uniref:hypothetical protein n=1 Tax=Nocardia harenae TaxID=358707 RepID=UPI000829FD0E|nr:hypothetical protein [Nocardia harenae]